jgi:transposase
MRKRLNTNKINVNGKMVNVGIDVHKQSWHVTALIEGVVVVAVTIQPYYSVLQKLLAQFKGAKIRIAYEAGFSGFNLYEELKADGMECIVVPPSLIPVESGNRVKTDKRDSRKLAQYKPFPLDTENQQYHHTWYNPFRTLIVKALYNIRLKNTAERVSF